MHISVEKKQTVKGEIHLITIQNEKNFEVCFTDYGAAVYYIAYPDKKGEMGKVTTALKDLNDFITNGNNYEKVIGPVAIRIKDAEATIDGTTYHFEKNEANNNLHSGSANFGNHLFAFSISANERKVDLTFTHEKKDMEGGFPGNVKAKVVYTIYENKKELNIKFSAKTDKPTLVNMTSHIYFNLNGGIKPVNEQILKINASKVSTFDNHLIIQSFDPVNDLLDFREGKKVKEAITSPTLLNHRAHGLDHIFLLDNVDKTKPAASLTNPENGRKVTVYTSSPAVVCYSDNFPTHLTNLALIPEEINNGLTFETITPNFHLEDVTLRPDQTYTSFVKYKFN